MAIALGCLAAACVTTGAAGHFMLSQGIAPAAADILNGAGWSAAVLAGAGRLPAAAVAFSYGDPLELAVTAACVAAGLLAVLCIVVLAICAPDLYRGRVVTAYLGGWGPRNGQVLGVAITGWTPRPRSPAPAPRTATRG